MKKERNERESLLFLLELLFSVLLFAVIGAVSLRLYLRSRLLREETAALQEAEKQAVTAAELLRASEGKRDYKEKLSKAFPGAEEREDGIRTEVLFEISPGKSGKELVLTVEYGERDGLLESVIRVTDEEGEEVYSLRTARFTGEEAGNE